MKMYLVRLIRLLSTLLHFKEKDLLKDFELPCGGLFTAMPFPINTEKYGGGCAPAFEKS